MKRKRSVDKTAGPPSRRAPSGAAILQAAVTAALTKALFLEWSRTGYGALSLEAVARRAGVGKAALYRRWPSKLAMVTDRLEQLGLEVAAMPEIPDTGSLRGDVRALLTSVRRLLRHTLVRHILPDLHAEMLRSQDLASAIRGRLQVERGTQGATIVRRAIARGEIAANIDLDLANDAFGGIIYWRMIVAAGQADDKYLDRLASFLVAALTRQ